MYNTRFSRLIITLYCKWNYDDPKYLDQFQPASGNTTYQSFQDFFTRSFRNPVPVKHNQIWACEGLLCEYGRVSELKEVNVKGQRRHLRNIFGQAEIPDGGYFSNVFLHNNNYHRIHAPVSGKISRIEHIPGDLVILRPWIYKNDPSVPALRNERVNVDIATPNGTWFLSIVGGPAVGTIVLQAGLALGSHIAIGDELAKFLLGSTCCIVSPVPVCNARVGDQVEVGQPL
jgi:phosphatidylserine decarboxylase